MSTPCPKRAELALLVDGELTENRARAVRGHLERCARCREEVRVLDSLVVDLSAATTEGVDVDAVEAAILALTAERPVEAAPAAPRRPRSLVVGLSAAAAVAVVGFIVLLSSFSVSPDTDTEPSPPAAAPITTRASAPVFNLDDTGLTPVRTKVNASLQQLLFEEPGSTPAECVCRHPAVFRQSL